MEWFSGKFRMTLDSPKIPMFRTNSCRNRVYFFGGSANVNMFPYRWIDYPENQTLRFQTKIAPKYSTQRFSIKISPKNKSKCMSHTVASVFGPRTWLPHRLDFLVLFRPCTKQYLVLGRLQRFDSSRSLYHQLQLLDCFDQIFEFSVGYELLRWFPCRLLLQHSENEYFDN